MSVHFETQIVKTCVVTIPGDEYDTFKHKDRALSITSWIFLIGPFVAALVYIFTAVTLDVWWYGVIACVLALIVAFICSIGCKILQGTLAEDVAIKYGWKRGFPLILRPDYQRAVHD